MSIEKIEEIFISQLINSKNDVVDKIDIIRIGEEYGIEFKKRVSRTATINQIVGQGYLSRLFEAFQEFIYIPVWVVADYYKLNTDQILQLSKLGVIREGAKEEEFYNRKDRLYYTANTYPISTLTYDKDNLKKSYKEAFGGTKYKLRIDANTEDEINEFVELISQIVEIKSDISIYDKRNEGNYGYLEVSKINYSELEEKRLTNEIQGLKNEIKELRKNHIEEKEEIRRRFKDIFGTVSIMELMDIKCKYDKFMKLGWK